MYPVEGSKTCHHLTIAIKVIEKDPGNTMMLAFASNKQCSNRLALRSSQLLRADMTSTTIVAFTPTWVMPVMPA
ncbi:hypothetical protein BJP07_05825 [Corynebacterium sp. NML130628]|nr:hypothetical protein BJP07_05825 [Corynebacterium sp. NML130628]